jgi:hydroxymethylpyrimidine pyrophosphatase-like HAD family hydrolase
LFVPVGGLGGFAVYYDGALTIQEADGTVYEHRGVSGAMTEAISRRVAEQYPEAIISYEVQDRWCCVRPVPSTRYAELNMTPDDPLPDVVDWAYIRTHSATAIIISSLHAALALDKLEAAVRAEPVGDGRMMQIRNRWASKERALRSVLATLGISPAHTLAIGDGLNDLGLFRLCGVSVAMGNALPAVRQAATYTTGSQDEDGVAQALAALGVTSPPP